MAGIKYITKQTLIDAWKALIFPNKTKLITGAKHQQAGLDLIESLWDRSTGCVTTVFNGTGPYHDVVVVRTICGDSVEIKISVTNKNNELAWVGETGFSGVSDGFVTINDVLELNQNGARWFKITNFSSIINSYVDGLGEMGHLRLNDLSSFSSGTPTQGDLTSLLISGGSNVGSGRHYVADQIDVLNNSYDVDEGGTVQNYMTKSPKDLSVSGLNLTIMNEANYYNNNGFPTPNGTYVVHIKGLLI